ncbi:histidine phosphatase family protein [Uliginosibacterium gangwonense]|uniref:histidine phosphatase family protein n=1 Tax=Uliginosibacterium gangwonense TaxID=392736 RepID=UPI000373779C|nr:histidine phosphatase family protein [Uliginosibacterium gangwonense]
MTTVYLLRHGALMGDSRHHFVGQIDLPLAPEGLAQATALARALQAREIESIHCSDLIRCQTTARILAENLHVPIFAHKELREISLGDWEGLPRGEVAQRWAREFEARGRDIEHYRPPHGESFADCLARALPIWQSIQQTRCKAVAVVGHAGLNRVLLCHILGKPIAEMFHIEQDYACINVIDCGTESCHVRLINACATTLPACGEPLHTAL